VTYITSNSPVSRNPFPCSRLVFPLALFALLCSCAIAPAATLCVNPGGTSGCKSTITAAVASAATGDTIQVWKGTYKEQVIITKPVSLVALDPTSKKKPTIDAAGYSNGIFINGMSGAPNRGLINVLVAGLAVRNANFEGILIANSSNVTLADNHVFDNNKGLDLEQGTCPGIPVFETKEQADCGEGIHFMSDSHSSAVRNEVDNNSGGILITDETGTSRHNLISRNYVHDNGYACGITMASHGPAVTLLPSATVSFGVSFNTIADNVSANNGLKLPGAGAGVGMFAPFPGTTTHGNVVINNTLYGNGLPGVTMHNHVYSPFAPPVDLDENSIVGNTIYGNAADIGDPATAGTAGINIYSAGPVNGTIISQNKISHEAVDVSFNVLSGQLDVNLNNFETIGIGVDNLGTGVVNATNNWWLCPGGPGEVGCNTAVGPHIIFTPWLTAAF
jgi:parallel beta-helix repeat protein